MSRYYVGSVEILDLAGTGKDFYLDSAELHYERGLGYWLEDVHLLGVNDADNEYSVVMPEAFVREHEKALVEICLDDLQAQAEREDEQRAER